MYCRYVLFIVLYFRQGYTGRPCVLRGICETAKSQFTHENGLLSEILNVILT